MGKSLQMDLLLQIPQEMSVQVPVQVEEYLSKPGRYYSFATVTTHNECKMCGNNIPGDQKKNFTS